MNLRNEERLLTNQLLEECVLKTETMWNDFIGNDGTYEDAMAIVRESKASITLKKRCLILLFGPTLTVTFKRGRTDRGCFPRDFSFDTLSADLARFLKKIIYASHYHNLQFVTAPDAQMRDNANRFNNEMVIRYADHYPDTTEDMLGLLEWRGWVVTKRVSSSNLLGSFLCDIVLLSNIGDDIKKKIMESLVSRMRDTSLTLEERGNLFTGFSDGLNYALNKCTSSAAPAIKTGVSLLLETEFARAKKWWVLERYDLPKFIKTCYQTSLRKSFRAEGALLQSLARNLILGTDPWSDRLPNKFGDRELAFGHPYEDDVLSEFYRELQKILGNKDRKVVNTISRLRREHQSEKRYREKRDGAIAKKKQGAFKKITA